VHIWPIYNDHHDGFWGKKGIRATGMGMYIYLGTNKIETGGDRFGIPCLHDGMSFIGPFPITPSGPFHVCVRASYVVVAGSDVMAATRPGSITTCTDWVLRNAPPYRHPTRVFEQGVATALLLRLSAAEARASWT
jgi:hypothetical protein